MVKEFDPETFLFPGFYLILKPCHFDGGFELTVDRTYYALDSVVTGAFLRKLYENFR